MWNEVSNGTGKMTRRRLLGVLVFFPIDVCLCGVNRIEKVKNHNAILPTPFFSCVFGTFFSCGGLPVVGMILHTDDRQNRHHLSGGISV